MLGSVTADEFWKIYQLVVVESISIIWHFAQAKRAGGLGDETGVSSLSFVRTYVRWIKGRRG